VQVVRLRDGGAEGRRGLPGLRRSPKNDGTLERLRLRAAAALPLARRASRRSSTPVLSRKKLYGLAFFLFSLSAAAIVFVVGPYAPWARVVDAIVLAAGVVCAVRLGRIGQGLLQAIFPG
jgi:hypothetical protein